MAHALRALVRELSPEPIFSFRSFTTNAYKFNLFEIQTGLKFILLSSVTAEDLTPYLQRVYQEAYQEYCTRNLLYK